MSTKKTWFSYILWLLATGFSVCFLGINTGELVSVMGLYGATTFAFRTLYSAILLVVAIVICIGLCLLSQKITMPTVSKRTGRGLHIMILLSIIVIFVITRINAVFDVVYDSQVVFNLYEASKIGQIDAVHESVSFLDNMYKNLLSGTFLFLGNKVEVMLYVQLFLQTCSFLLLIYIGIKRLSGFAIWVPVAGYAVSPLFADGAADLGAANFWFFIVVCLVALICILDRFLPQKEYIAEAIVTGFAFIAGIALFFMKISSFAFGSYSVQQKEMSVVIPAYYIGSIILAFLLILYCVAFWFTSRKCTSVYIIAVYLFAGLLSLLQPGELEMERFLLMLMHFYLYFMVAHGLFILITEKTETGTVEESVNPQWGEMSRAEIGKRDAAIMEEINSATKKSTSNTQNRTQETPQQEPQIKEPHKSEVVNEEPQPEKKEEKSKPSGFEWWEKNKKMEDKSIITEDVTVSAFPAFTPEIEKDPEEDETILIRVSDIVKNTSSVNEGAFSLTNQSEEAKDITVVDKTAMIENVLPMPKKHINRTLDYAIEPTADQMCYDIEISADDDYDYPAD